jgi:branched-chain amino acid transport system substrate-binding protein
VVLLGAAAATCLLAGCGGGRSEHEGTFHGTRLRIYSSAPLAGPDGTTARSVVQAQRLALAQDGGRIGRYRVQLVALDAATPKANDSDPAQISLNARRAAGDPETVAYLGELDTGSSAISIPLLNEAGILELSPLDGATALTRHTIAVTGSPIRFYPNQAKVGRTFARLVPADSVEAGAVLRSMQEQGVRRLALLTDDDPSGQALATSVQAAARRYGVAVVAPLQIDERAREHRGEVAQLVAAHADAVLYASGPREGTGTLPAIGLWHELARADPALKLFAPASLADASFVAGIGSAAAQTYVTRPVLPLRAYPPEARRFARAFAARYGMAPAPEALYGYESMRAVLAAIREAERDAPDRPLTRAAVVRAFFHEGERESVLGAYAIDAAGDSSLRRYGAFRVVAGRLRFVGALQG